MLKAEWSKWDGLPEHDKLWEYAYSTNINHSDVRQTVGTPATDCALIGPTNIGPARDFEEAATPHGMGDVDRYGSVLCSAFDALQCFRLVGLHRRRQRVIDLCANLRHVVAQVDTIKQVALEN